MQITSNLTLALKMSLETKIDLSRAEDFFLSSPVFEHKNRPNSWRKPILCLSSPQKKLPHCKFLAT